MNNAKEIVIFLSFCTIITTLPKHIFPEPIAFLQKIQPNGYSKNITTQLQYIQCLAESTYFLSRLHKQFYCYQPSNVIVQNNCIQIDSVSFLHRAIRSCLKKIIRTESLNPLLMLLQEAQYYQITQDNLFFHECFLLIFVIHKQILFYECEHNGYVLKKTTLDTIIEISNTINQLPISEVLSAIDMLINELPPFVEKYELNSKITWKNWLKKYWWVPPIFSVWFGLKILLRLQRHHFYFSPPYTSPKPSIPLQPITTNDPALLEIRREESIKKEPL